MDTPSNAQRVSTRRFLLMTAVASLIVLAPGVLLAESGKSNKEDKGFVLWETFQGNHDTPGTVAKLDTMAGYRFGSHFEMDAGLPFYFVHASDVSTTSGFSSGNGIGNVYLDLQYRVNASSADFVSSITGTAPTGDPDKGFSTGRVTFDWNNYLAFNAGRITPYANAGLANTISDTRFFTRPFSSLGMVAHFEGGVDLQVWRAVSIGASAYAVTPFGQQKIYSKVKHGQGATQEPGSSSGQGKKGVFESQSVTVGDASIARDNGGSAWLDLRPGRVVDFQLGISRSLEYDLTSVYFSVVLNLGRWITGNQ